MKPQKQMKLVFENDCKCLVDFNLLEKAMLWYSKDTLMRIRKIYMYGEYAGVSIYNKKIHVHRLLMFYKSKTILPSSLIVHHIDGNKLNCQIDNLEISADYRHGSYHNKGKVLSLEHRSKISEANKKRKGVRRKPKRPEVTPKIVYEMKRNGLSFNQISVLFNISWSSIRQRHNDFIHDNKELIEEI